MCDEEMTGTGPVYGPTARARELYAAYTDNHPTIHSNRFPIWDDLSDDAKDEWYIKAARS